MFVGVICTAIYWIYWPCIWPGFLLAARVIVRHCPAKLPLADYKSGWVLKPFGFPVHSLRIPVNTLYHHGFWNPYYCSNINYSKNLDVAIHIYIYKYTHMDTHSIYVQYTIYTRIISILTFAERRCKYIPRHGHWAMGQKWTSAKIHPMLA